MGHSKGYCHAHAERIRRNGNPGNALIGKASRGRAEPTRREAKDGYVYISREVQYELEHRAVMSEYLGRKLLPKETIHHKNGKRNDNRIQNLELWTKMHPAGQRVEDMLAFCKEFLDLYDV